LKNGAPTKLLRAVFDSKPSIDRIDTPCLICAFNAILPPGRRF